MTEEPARHRFPEDSIVHSAEGERGKVLYLLRDGSNSTDPLYVVQWESGVYADVYESALRPKD